jgi:integrase
MQTRITAAQVRRLLDQPPSRDMSVFDTALPRFAFRIKPPRRPGAKPPALYFVRYTAPDGAERRMKIGDPGTMSVDEARKEAKAKLALVDAGRDPKKERDKVRAAPTLREVTEHYLASDKFVAKVPKVQANDRARIEAHILPRLGSDKAEGVTAVIARRLRHQVANDTRRNKRKRQLGGPGAARKVLRLLAAILRWAKDDGMIAELPFALRELDLGGDGSRDAVITTPEEYARLFTTMDEKAVAGTLRPEARAFFILVASTGLRRSEAQNLRWGQVNLQRRQITLTASKGGKLARQRGTAGTQTEIVGLPPIAAVALAELQPEPVAGNALVFPPTRGHQLSVNRDWVAVRKAAGLPPELTLHGLRHSVGTVGAIAGMSMPELQALLRHRQPGTTARYIHMAQMAAGLADKAMSGVLPTPATPSADIMPPRRRV